MIKSNQSAGTEIDQKQLKLTKTFRHSWKKTNLIIHQGLKSTKTSQNQPKYFKIFENDQIQSISWNRN